MKKLLKKSTSLLLALVLLTLLCLPALAAERPSTEAPIENMGLGGGGAFLHSLINPTDSSNYIATCDMGSLYRSNDRGVSWDRTETRCAIREACFAPDGTLFIGDYGLYVSHDKGETLELIYPQNVVHSVSRMGTREQLFAAQGYSNGLVCCIAVYNNQVYFATQDWNSQMKVLRCNFDGSGLTELYSQQKYLEPTRADYGIVADASGIYFSDGQGLYRLNPSTKTAQRLYSAAGPLCSFTKIGDTYYVLEELSDRTRILYTSDFYTYKDLNDKNTLRNSFTWDETHYFQWRFKKIVGNNSDHIYLSFESDCTGLDYKLYGVLTYNGTNFEWIYDSAFKHRSTLNLDHPLGWTYNLYGDIFDINPDPNDDHRVIMANLETVYELVYRGAQDYDVRTLHCNESADGVFYTTSGLDVQDTHTVRQDPFDPQHIIIATTDMGMQLSYDGGSTWRRHNRNGQSVLENCYDIYFDTDTQDLVYGIWSSRNGGAKNPNTDLLSPYGKGGFAVSRDGGINWDTSYSTGLPANSLPVSMSVVDKGDSLTIAVATCNNGFYISHDSGRTFSSISGRMAASNGGIWGGDVLIVGDTVYCLTAFDRINGVTASKLYAYDLTTGATTQVDLGDVVIGRSLTYDETQGLFLSVVSYYKYKWMPGDIDTSVNYGGGVYKIENNSATLLYSEPDGIHHCAFTPDGTMYATGVYGKLYVAQDGELVLYRGDLFEAMKIITFSNDYTQMYITTDGGGTYRIDTLYTPEAPENPEQPETPDDPEQPDIPDQPGQPDVPDQPGQPDVPDQPGQPDAPDQPGQPDVPDQPGQPDIPDQPGQPDVPDQPGQPDIPEQPGHIHTEVIRNSRAATCTEYGYTGDTRCSECGEVLRKGTSIPMLPHTEELRSVRAATCTSTGYTGDTYCVTCGNMLIRGTQTPKIPHTEVIRNARPATCTSLGYTGDYVCTVCVEYSSIGTNTPKLPHTERAVCNGDQTHSMVCDVCGHVSSTDSCADTNGDARCDSCGGQLPQRSFSPETFQVSLSNTSTKRNKAVTMKVKTSEDVTSIYVNGVKVQNYNTTSETTTTGNGKNRVKVTVKYHVFTYTLKESTKGTYSYDVIACNSSGQQSSPKTAWLQVK